MPSQKPVKPVGFAADPEKAREAGGKGGETLKERRGVDHFKTIGKMGGSNLKAARGPEYYAEIGRKGGMAKHKKAKGGDKPAVGE